MRRLAEPGVHCNHMTTTALEKTSEGPVSSRPFSPQFGEEGRPFPEPPGFGADLRARVKPMVVARGSQLSAARWSQLGQVLGRYYFSSGLISPDDARKLNVVVSNAKRLKNALRAVDEADLRTFLTGSEGTREGARLVGLEELASLPLFEARPPNFSDEVQLLADLMEWWISVGGTVSTRHDTADVDGGGSAFVEFAKLIVTALPVASRPAVSVETVSRRRHAVQRAAENQSRLLKNLVEKLLLMGKGRT